VRLREIAERIEYSAAAIYGYFTSKDDIFAALADEDFAVLARRLSDAAQQGAHPRERLRLAGQALYEFAKSNPILLARGEMRGSAAGLPYLRDCTQRLNEVAALLEPDIRALCRLGHPPEEPRSSPAIQLLWLPMLGAAIAAPRFGDDADALARELLETLLSGLSR
jgi:AcrR family transcriptional regulator